MSIKIAERIVYEETSTDPSETVILGNINFNTRFGMSTTDRFTALINIRVWTYTSAPADGYSSASLGSYDISSPIVINRHPNDAAIKYIPRDSDYEIDVTNGDPTLGLRTHIKGSSTMIDKIMATIIDAESVNIVIQTGEAAAAAGVVLEHMVVVDIELFGESA